MYYNITNVNGPVGWLQMVNGFTNNLFGPAIVGAFFIVMLIAMSKSNQGRNEPEKTLAVSLGLSTFLSFFLLAIGMVGLHIVMITAVGFLFSIFIVKKAQGGP